MIKVKDLCFSYGSVQCLEHISLNLEEGKIYGLLGENGVGKTTLLTLLSGLKKVQTGSIDVDGFTPENVGKMLIGDDCFLPCTPHGIIKLIEVTGMELAGKHAVVIGRSNIVGKPVAALLSRKSITATDTLCHTGTKDLAAFTRTADVVVVAAGSPDTLTGDMLKPGAVVIDVGVNRVPDATKGKGYRLCGDADFESCAEVASAITPVPGGVGPMTITMLLWNTLESAKKVCG